MEDLTPQEKIDLIDLVRYAYDNKYIKWHCEMKMDDPVRKIMQRILKKMFKGATITKNRRAGAYNVSFNKERRFHGDCPDYIGDNLFVPSKIIDLRYNLEFFLEKIDRIFWPYIQAALDTKKITPTYSRYSYYGGGDNPMESTITEEELEASSRNMDINETVSDLYRLIHLFNDFQANYTMPDITIEENGDDNYYGRRMHYIRKVLANQQYGFSLYYKIIQEYDPYGMAIQKSRKLARPLIRRFNQGGELMERLESLTKAFEIFKEITVLHEKYRSFFFATRRVKDFSEHFVDYSNAVSRLNLSRDERERNKQSLLNIGMDEFFHTQHFNGTIIDRDEAILKNTSEEENDTDRRPILVERTPVPVVDPNVVRIGNSSYDKEEIRRRFFESIEEGSE